MTIDSNHSYVAIDLASFCLDRWEFQFSAKNISAGDNLHYSLLGITHPKEIEVVRQGSFFGYPRRYTQEKLEYFLVMEVTHVKEKNIDVTQLHGKWL